MTNLKDIKSNVFIPGSIIADLYDVSGNIPHLIGKTSIKPYRAEMQKDINEV